ncbi:hypothetical protein BKA83DRAFT_4313311, partial [Pisolithus microcarpus]
MDFAIMKSLKRCMEEQGYQTQPASLSFCMSLWFPLQWTISHPRQSITMPMLSSSMWYSRHYYAELGLGSILVFEYLYFLLQMQDGRNNLQESLTLAVKEYQSSGIHTKVNKSIQTAFEHYGDSMDDLCPILLHIAKENQLLLHTAKIPTRNV